MSTQNSEKRPGGRRYGSRLLAIVIGTALTFGLAILLFWQVMLVRVPPGHVGVLYSLLFRGTDTNFIYPEGLAVKLPWDRIYIFETRVQAMPFRVEGLSAEGMTIVVDATTLYRLEASKAPLMLKQVGPDYSERIVKATSTAELRQILAQYNSHELYTVDAAQISAELMRRLRATPQGDLIYYQDVLVRSVTLSDAMTHAIQQKLAEEQRAESYEYKLAAERLEAERLRVQAIGLRNFYSIVQGSLTDKLLTWRGIEATVQIAKSPNSKIVIVGGNKEQMPLILGSDIARAPKTPDAPVTPVTKDEMPLPSWEKEPLVFGNPLEAIQPRPPTAPSGLIGEGKTLNDLVNPTPSPTKPKNP